MELLQARLEGRDIELIVQELGRRERKPAVGKRTVGSSKWPEATRSTKATSYARERVEKLGAELPAGGEHTEAQLAGGHHCANT